MKVARFAELKPVLTLSELFSGAVGPAGQVPVSNGSNVSWASNVQTIFSNGSNALLGPLVNFASGSNIIFTLDAGPGGSVPSNTLRIHGGAGAGGGIAGITVKNEGSTLSTLADTLDFVGAGVDATGTGATKTITIGGGGGSSGYELDSYSIDGTYGDDFTSSSLSGIWTRRNFTSGAETHQLGKNATYMRVAATSRAAGDGYFQTAPAGDWTFAMAFVPHYVVNISPFSLCVVNSVGTGTGVMIYNSPFALIVAGITTYSTYSGTFQQTTTYSSAPAEPGISDRKMWLQLRKSGTDYFGAVSFDGEIWGPETPAFSSAITVDRVGMILHPLWGTQTTSVTDIDWFNKIA